MNVMDKQNYPELEWGCTAVLPVGLRCAWGARAICTRGNIDIPYDRHGFFGAQEDRHALSVWLNSHLSELEDCIRRYYRDGSLGAGNAPQAYVWENYEGMIFGWYRGGYLYLAAFIHEHAPDEKENQWKPGEKLRGFLNDKGEITQGADRLLAIWDEIKKQGEAK